MDSHGGLTAALASGCPCRTIGDVAVAAGNSPCAKRVVRQSASAAIVSCTRCRPIVIVPRVIVPLRYCNARRCGSPNGGTTCRKITVADGLATRRISVNVAGRNGVRSTITTSTLPSASGIDSPRARIRRGIGCPRSGPTVRQPRGFRFQASRCRPSPPTSRTSGLSRDRRVSTNLMLPSFAPYCPRPPATRKPRPRHAPVAMA